MTELDFDTDQFLQLLTDALRAGPGSPEWHDAVTRLRDRGAPSADAGSNGTVQLHKEYQLLIAAREHLESGREYRSVRPGPRFTSRVMDAIDEEGGRRPRGPMPTTRIVGLLGIVLLIGALAVVAYLLWRPTGSGADPAIDALAHSYFSTTLLATDFDGPLPDDWRTIGALPIDTSRGFRPAAPPQETTRTGQPATTMSSTTMIGSGGGAYWTRPLPTDKPVELSAAVRVPRGDDEATVAQLFVTDDPSFTDDRATSGHELVWLLQDGQSRIVLPGGRMESQRASAAGTPNRRPPTIALRIAIDRDVAIVEENGQPLWSGAHGLSPGKPRYVGLRFLRAGTTSTGKPEQSPVFTSLKVQTP